MIMMTRAEEDGSDAQVVSDEEVATLCYFESITNTVLQQGTAMTLLVINGRDWQTFMLSFFVETN